MGPLFEDHVLAVVSAIELRPIIAEIFAVHVNRGSLMLVGSKNGPVDALLCGVR